MWREWDTDPPEPGQKVVIVCDDGCSTSAALIIDQDGAGKIEALDAEDGMELVGIGYTKGSLWAALPESYAIAFLEYTHD